MKTLIDLLPSAFFSTVFGVVLGFLGNFIVQHILYRRSVRIDAFRNMLTEYTMIVSKYWIGSHESAADKATAEAEIKVRQMILMSEFRSLSKKYSAVRRIWTNDRDQIRADLLRDATGGLFESTNWKPDPNRAHAVTRTASRVLARLP
ncbi:MAG: hypothetical protein OXO49_08185 [Gammaproteobacteria bacterium]|nr:hypothetical protein [Gammaproteobacteria bacterium]MDE0251549.1 hypothetical protein [Gammaproteobacteria bacterium]MDE0403441.1 hypothetical protein [Gammaproteobacteria bacterium]